MNVAGGLEKTAWRFADVTVTSEHYSRLADGGDMFERVLVADEDGRFVIENVPAGMNYLAVLYPGLHDYQFPFEWATQVIAGKTTEVRTFERTKESQLAASITVGDGSRDVEISDETFERDGPTQFRIPQLWPGDWTVQLMRKDKILTSARMKISGTETVTADLVFDSRRQH